MKRLLRWCNTRRRQLVLLALCLALGLGAGLAVRQLQRPAFMGVVDEVWLPSRSVVDWPDGSVDTLEKVRVVQPKGMPRALLFASTTTGGYSVFQAPASDRLRPSACPNVFGVETLLPSDCKKVGDIHGAAVYTIRRSLPLGRSEAFATLGNNFVAVNVLGSDEAVMLGIMRNFARVPNDKVRDVLASNKAAAAKKNAEVKKKADAEAARQADAYKHLSFTPVLPASLPAGWKSNVLNIAGLDPAKPQMVVASYVKDQLQILVYVGNSADFVLDDSGRCSPALFISSQPLACGYDHTHGYFAGATNTPGYTTQYIYRHVGTAVAVITATAGGQSGQRPEVSADHYAALQAIALSLAPVEKTALKGATYSRMAYY